MHSVVNRPRDHSVMYALEALFKLKPAYPAINFEPYYTGWNHEINKPNGEWSKSIAVQADNSGIIILPDFPDKQNPAKTDWAAKIRKTK